MAVDPQAAHSAHDNGLLAYAAQGSQQAAAGQGMHWPRGVPADFASQAMMAAPMQAHRTGDEYMLPLDFVASLRSVAPFVTLLRAISFKQRAYCTIAYEGIRFTAEDSRTVQAKAYLPKSLFREFRWSDNTPLAEDEELSFMVDIRMLGECLTIFGGQQQSSGSAAPDDPHGAAAAPAPAAAASASPVSLQLSYPKAGGELTLLLQDGSVVTACNLSTYDNEPITDLHAVFGDRPIISKIIMKSDWLKTAFAEIDDTSSDLTLTIAPQHPFLRISASGLAGESELDYPRDTEVLESFSCTVPSRNKYKFSMLNPCLKALGMSTKTSIRVNEIGILSMQFMIHLAASQISFVDYVVLPIEEAN
ncbi:checkpoint clamp complex protein Rad1 [Polyrhizophydium stewartii]|uniref:Checkpoint clamp complex protein Rad1 n=1 Tax=Polyrhizophydium stewartii TaxID=2732419 RepID=A0ABR4N7E1_9FUNG